jgi:Tol biopolymer transport system component
VSAFGRREFLSGAAGAVAVAVTAPRAVATGPARQAERPAQAGLSLRLREGTDIAAQLSPDGGTVAMDALGVLWLLPASGGDARRLTSDLFDIAQPEWSPDGSTLTFQSYRDGCFNIWLVQADGSGLRQLTRGPYDHREPRFSPDGRQIAFSTDVSGSYGIVAFDLATGATATVADGAGQEYEPAWSPDGSRVVFVVDNTRIDVVELASGARTTVVTVPAGEVLHSPAWTPDGATVVYYRLAAGRTSLMIAAEPLVSGEEIFPFRVSWRSAREFVYTADGGIRRRSLDGGQPQDIGFAVPVEVAAPQYRTRQRDFDSTAPRPVVGIGSPVLSPDGRQVAFRALNDIYTMRIGGRPRPLTGDPWWKQDPAWSPDGRYLSYSTDRSGTLDIWLRDLRSGQDRQLTALPNAAAVSGSWSADGSELAFLDQTGAL